jgi:hypothetical protein
MADRTADVQAHWTRPGVLARIDAALNELGHDPKNLNPEIDQPPLSGTGGMLV